ncbi:MAG: hypothetical protein ACOYMA_15255, partial [Bacteroidia bacterium]
MKKNLLLLFFFFCFAIAKSQTNIAPLAVASASTCNTGACATLNDLALGTCGTQSMWITSSASNPGSAIFIAFTWGSVKSFNKMTIHVAQDNTRFLGGGTIEIFNGSAWVTHSTFTQSTGVCIYDINFPIATASAVRIVDIVVIGSQSSNVNFREIEIIEAQAAGPPQPPIANFYAPDTVWINSPATLINTSSFQSRVFWDFPGENPLQTGYYRQAGFIDTAKYYNNITYTFTSPGLKLVKLLAVNNIKRDSLRDSIYKYIYVDTPSQAPRADFITFKRIMGITEEAPFIDLSTNGPTQWDWTIDPPCISCITDPANGIANYFITGTGQLGYNVASPRLAAFDPGQFKVCLRVWNLRGTDSICKNEYIKVVEGNYMCSGSGGFVSTQDEGFLYGISGPYQTYARSSWPSNCPGFTVAPCADSITLFVERIKMWPTDSIVFYN